MTSNEKLTQKESIMFEYFSALNLKATYGSVVLYRNGQYMAKGFESISQAKSWAKNFCDLNGYRFVWAK